MTAVRRLYSGRLLLHIAKIESRYNDLTLNGEIKNSVNGKQQRSIYVINFCLYLPFTVHYSIFMPVSLIRIVLDSFYLSFPNLRL